MNDEEVKDFFDEGENWHKTKAKDRFVKDFRKKLKGDKNPDFYLEKETKEVILRGRINNKIYVRTKRFYKK